MWIGSGEEIPRDLGGVDQILGWLPGVGLKLLSARAGLLGELGLASPSILTEAIGLNAGHWGLRGQDDTVW